MHMWSILGQFGAHLLSCGHGNLLTKRHDSLCNVIFMLFCLTTAKVVVNNVVLVRVTAGLVTFITSLRRPGYFDVSVRNPSLPSYVSEAALRCGVAAESGERIKDSRHEDLVTASGHLAVWR